MGKKGGEKKAKAVPKKASKDAKAGKNQGKQTSKKKNRPRAQTAPPPKNKDDDADEEEEEEEEEEDYDYDYDEDYDYDYDEDEEEEEEEKKPSPIELRLERAKQAQEASSDKEQRLAETEVAAQTRSGASGVALSTLPAALLEVEQSIAARFAEVGARLNTLEQHSSIIRKQEADRPATAPASITSDLESLKKKVDKLVGEPVVKFTEFTVVSKGLAALEMQVASLKEQLSAHEAALQQATQTILMAEAEGRSPASKAFEDLSLQDSLPFSKADQEELEKLKAWASEELQTLRSQVDEDLKATNVRIDKAATLNDRSRTDLQQGQRFLHSEIKRIEAQLKPTNCLACGSTRSDFNECAIADSKLGLGRLGAAGGNGFSEGVTGDQKTSFAAPGRNDVGTPVPQFLACDWGHDKLDPTRPTLKKGGGFSTSASHFFGARGTAQMAISASLPGLGAGRRKRAAY